MFQGFQLTGGSGGGMGNGGGGAQTWASLDTHQSPRVGGAGVGARRPLCPGEGREREHRRGRPRRAPSLAEAGNRLTRLQSWLWWGLLGRTPAPHLAPTWPCCPESICLAEKCQRQGSRPRVCLVGPVAGVGSPCPWAQPLQLQRPPEQPQRPQKEANIAADHRPLLPQRVSSEWSLRDPCSPWGSLLRLSPSCSILVGRRRCQLPGWGCRGAGAHWAGSGTPPPPRPRRGRHAASLAASLGRVEQTGDPGSWACSPADSPQAPGTALASPPPRWGRTGHQVSCSFFQWGPSPAALRAGHSEEGGRVPEGYTFLVPA